MIRAAPHPQHCRPACGDPVQVGDQAALVDAHHVQLVAEARKLGRRDDQTGERLAQTGLGQELVIISEQP